MKTAQNCKKQASLGDVFKERKYTKTHLEDEGFFLHYHQNDYKISFSLI